MYRNNNDKNDLALLNIYYLPSSDLGTSDIFSLIFISVFRGILNSANLLCVFCYVCFLLTFSYESPEALGDRFMDATPENLQVISRFFSTSKVKLLDAQV